MLENHNKTINSLDVCIDNENFKIANTKFRELSEKVKRDIGEGFHLDAISYFKQAKETELYKLINTIPKGALLHHHLMNHAVPEYLIDIAIKEDKFVVDESQENIFRIKNGINTVNGNIFHKLSQIKSVETITNLFLFNNKNLHENIWVNFDKKYLNSFKITSNTKHFKDYILKTFNDCLEEGILIYQARHYFGIVAIYDTLSSDEIKFIDPIEEINIILEVLEAVRKREPLFEVNIIYSVLRTWPLERIQKELERCVYLKNLTPEIDNLILGFDLVGDESLRESQYFSQLLHDYREKVIRENLLPNSKLEYYLHAGETMSESNINIIDSIKLDCRRIGHGLNLIKHPNLISTIKAKRICLEINPLSNQVLNYVQDLREHPLKYYYESGIVLTINSDDDGLFGTGSLMTFDMFVCVMCLDMDLGFLFSCILNSLNYSGIKSEKLEVIKYEWKIRWEEFISNLVSI